MKIIPAIDLLDGKCVRLNQGNFDTQKVYHADPVEVAKQFESQGMQYLHLVDLDGARSKQIVNAQILSDIATETSLTIDFGGGIKSTSDAETAINCGADKINISSIAVEDKSLFIHWLETFGVDNIILSADCRDRNVATRGWQATSEIDIIDLIHSYEPQGLKQVVCTDINRDGMMQGPSVNLYKQVLNETDIDLIASGGVSSVNDLKELGKIGCSGAIIGKAIYEQKITMKQLRNLC